MTMILEYLYEYVKTNSLTAYFFIFLGVLVLAKYVPLRFSLPRRQTLIAIVVLGLLLRIAWLFYSSHQPMSDWSEPHMLENDIINVQAIELTEGIWFHDEHGEPSARRPIGYPLALAVVYKVFGIHLETAWIMNLFFYLASILLLYGIARTLFSEGLSLTVALLFAVNPISIYSIKLLTDEHLFLPLWYGGLFLLLREVCVKEVRWGWLWYGVLFGYATITRTHSIFMPLVVGLAYWLARFSWKKILSGIILTGFVMQLVNLPWVIRNYREWQEVVLYTATSNFIYAQVNSTAGPEGGGHIPEQGEEGYSEELQLAIEKGNPAKVHKISNRLMLRWMATHPAEFTVMGISRLLFFMNWNRKDGVWPLWYQYYPGSFDPKRPLIESHKRFFEEYAFSFYYTLLYSFLIGIFLLIRRGSQLPASTRLGLLVLGSCFIFWFAEHMIIYPIRKYRYPLEPLMTLYAVYFFHYLWVHVRPEIMIGKIRDRISKRNRT